MTVWNKPPFVKQLHHQADYVPDPELRELVSFLSFQVTRSCWASVQKASLLQLTLSLPDLYFPDVYLMEQFCMT
jgi:hypothetical protein